MKPFTCALALLGLALTLSASSGQDEKQPKIPRQLLDPQKVKALMHRKVDNAQKILEALAVNDLAKAGKHAEALLQVSREAEWVIFKTREYELNSEDFRRSLGNLIKHTKDKNLEGAQLTYLEMTLTCFHCHRYVRDVGMVRLVPADAGQ